MYAAGCPYEVPGPIELDQFVGTRTLKIPSDTVLEADVPLASVRQAAITAGASIPEFYVAAVASGPQVGRLANQLSVALVDHLPDAVAVGEPEDQGPVPPGSASMGARVCE